MDPLLIEYYFSEPDYPGKPQIKPLMDITRDYGYEHDQVVEQIVGDAFFGDYVPQKPIVLVKRR